MSTLKLQGCRVLLLPYSTNQVSNGGICVPDVYGHENTKFRVEAIGPGRWVSRGNKRNKIWVQPEVKPGDIVISKHWCLEPPPGYHKTHHIDSEVQTSRATVDCRMIVAIVGHDQRL